MKGVAAMPMAFGMNEDAATTAQRMEFISWLKTSHPDYQLARLPAAEIDALAAAFCQMQGYPDVAAFARNLRHWQRPAAAPRTTSSRRHRRPRDNSYMHVQAEDTSANRETEMVMGLDEDPAALAQTLESVSSGQRTSEAALAHYDIVPYHGMFLFMVASDFPGFIKKYRDDLDALTGDLLDVYYSLDDLQQASSAFKVIGQFRSLKIDRTALPALLLWQKTLAEGCAIPLQKLSHDDIFAVLQLIVQRIAEGKDLAAIEAAAIAEVAQLAKTMMPVINYNVSVGNITATGSSVAVGNDINIGTRPGSTQQP
jgi:hypothetical protein